jgi:spermidine/putrescine transport system permease protein
MSWRATRATRSLQAMWLIAVLILLYVPILSVALASLANTRYMRFPHKVWTLDAYREALGTYTTATLHVTSLKIALVVVALSVVLAVFGALAFARYDWRGRSWFRRFLLLPVFFPQPVLGLALLLSFTAVGIAPTWQTAAFAHLVWIVPIVTLVISIRLYSYDVMQEEAAFDLGATRAQHVCRYSAKSPCLHWLRASSRGRCLHSCYRGAICRYRSIRPGRTRLCPSGCSRERRRTTRRWFRLSP